MSESLAPARHETKETAIAAVEAYQTATVQSRIIAALNNPRNWDRVREDLLRECSRKSFASIESGGALYRIQYGDNVTEGFSIRFAETVAACMGNLLVESPVIFNSDDEVIYAVTVTDLERNTTWSRNASIKKRIERKDAKGRNIISQRTTSYGGTVFLVAATDDEIRAKANAEVSKTARTLIERALPGWLKEECLAQIKKTMASTVSEDPDSAKRTVLDYFRKTHKVGVDQLTEFVGIAPDRWTSAEISDLRSVAQALKDGIATWAEIVESRGVKDAEVIESQKGATKARTSSTKTKATTKRSESVADDLAADFDDLPAKDGLEAIDGEADRLTETARKQGKDAEFVAQVASDLFGRAIKPTSLVDLLPDDRERVAGELEVLS